MQSLLSPEEVGLRGGSQLQPLTKDADPGAVLCKVRPPGCWEKKALRGWHRAKEHQALGTGTRGTEVL